MPTIKEETAELLIKLDVLDKQLRVTPEAFVGAIARKPVDKQAELLGLPVIIRPFRKNQDSPEKQFIKYFKNRVKMHVDGGESYSSEGYIIKSFLSFIIPEFDYRKKQHQYSDAEIIKQICHIPSLNDIDIVKSCESFLDHDIKFIYKDEAIEEEGITKKYLSSRFRSADAKVISFHIDEISDQERINKAKSKEQENNYIRFLLEQLELWHSLSKQEWYALAEIVLCNWEKMYAGWPDLTFYSKDRGLILVEIKGSDKIHASQVFTILKLKEVLTEKRIAIGWLNSGKINFSGKVYTSHMNEVINWFNSPWKERKEFVQEIYKF